MDKLSERDFRKILNAIEILGEDVDFDSFPRRALGAIAAVVDIDFASYNEIDRATGVHRFLLRPDPADLDPGSFEYAAFVRRFGNHPMVAKKVVTAGRNNPGLQQFVNRVRLLGMVGNCCGQAELRLNMALSILRVESASRRKKPSHQGRRGCIIRLPNQPVLSALITLREHRQMQPETSPLTSKVVLSSPSMWSVAEWLAEKRKPSRRRNMTRSQRDSLARAYRWTRRQRFLENPLASIV
jgi:hypothetical protein